MDLKLIRLKNRSLFSVFDVLFVTWSIITFFADVGTDFIVTIKYFHNGNYFWATMTFGIMIIPAPVIQFFSLRWYKADKRLTKSLIAWHLTGFGVLKRYIDVLKTGFKIRKAEDVKDVYSLHQQQSNASMLRLFESFFESAPQLVLQLYIIVSTNHWTPWTGISALSSLISVSWGVAAYSKAMRNVRTDKDQITWFGLFLQTVWRVGMVSARVTAMVILAIAHKSWIFFVMAIHWIFAFVWVTLQQTDFCESWWEERIYNCVVAGIYCFCFFNIKEGKSRKRMALFYTIMFTENISFLVLYYCYVRINNHGDSHWILQAATGIIITCFLIGLLTMILYYRFLHPSGPIPCLSLPCVKNVFVNKSKTEMSKSSSSCYCIESVAIRTLKSNHPFRTTEDVKNSNEWQCSPINFNESLHQLGDSQKSQSMPSVAVNHTSLPNFHLYNSMPNLINHEATKIKKSNNSSCTAISSTPSNNIVQESLQSSSYSSSEFDSGLTDLALNHSHHSKSSECENHYNSNHVNGIEVPPNVVFDWSLPHYDKLLIEESCHLKKIKSQLGHAISFGDIPLFPPVTKKRLNMHELSTVDAPTT